MDYIERIHREKTSGAKVSVGHPNKVCNCIIKLKIDKGRLEILERQAKGCLDGS